MYIVKKPFKGNFCEYACTSNSLLTKYNSIHKIMYIVKKPFECDFCDYASKQKGDLTIYKSIPIEKSPINEMFVILFVTGLFFNHTQEHTYVEKPYICDVCQCLRYRTFIFNHTQMITYL